MRFCFLTNHFQWAVEGLIIAVAFAACGKRTCRPDSYSYENQRVYRCFAEHAPSTATKNRLIFECKKENFYPLIITQVVNHSGGTKRAFESFTCLDSEGNIELVPYPYGASLYCISEKAGQWKEVFNENFSRHVYYRCPGAEEYLRIFDEEVIRIEAQGAYTEDNLLVCPIDQKNTASSPTEAICG